jgi:hypothetical protein
MNLQGCLQKPFGEKGEKAGKNKVPSAKDLLPPFRKKVSISCTRLFEAAKPTM